MIASMEAAASLGRHRAATTSHAPALAARAYVSSNTGLPGAIRVDPNAGHSLGRRHATPQPSHSFGANRGRNAPPPGVVTSESFPSTPQPSTPPLAVAQPAGGAGGGAVPYPESPAEPPTNSVFHQEGSASTGLAGVPRTTLIVGGLALLVGAVLVARKVMR